LANTLSRTVALDLLERMLLARRFEEAVIAAAQTHKEVGRNHLAIGHEAIDIPAMALLRPEDRVHTTHRGHAHVVARGADPGRALAEVMGRSGGLSRGMGGSFHLCDQSVGFQPTSALVGGSMGLATGAALALKKAGRGGVSVAIFGDGTLDEGIAYEAFNTASLLTLPVLFLCINNSKVVGHETTSQLAAADLADVPRSLRVACVGVDGSDVGAVYATLEAALAKVRAEGAPVFVEARVERWPGCYQTQPEYTTGVTDLRMAWDETPIAGPHADWLRTADPILRFARALLADGLVTGEEIVVRDAAAIGRIAAARAFADASPLPKPEAALACVFV